jgi:hypothetical protein
MQALSTSIEMAPDGMLLAQPVLDAQGQLLLPAGTPVTRGILNSLRQRGIDTVFVNPTEGVASMPGKLDPATEQAQTEKRLLHLFRPAMRAGQLNPLFHLILRYRSAEAP